MGYIRQTGDVAAADAQPAWQPRGIEFPARRDGRREEREAAVPSMAYLWSMSILADQGLSQMSM
ncbi:hypothetical protein [Collinsella tanakaei]|uniref:hypothetical protein n=1 Tax=Collinsella tanakaei TaxID=626935 RepID=UPI0025A49ED2|nr:hypothetical protein [Collinsella tanakaei]MDM8300788.1 hypothetical protein [Collinsella tanakaei]